MLENAIRHLESFEDPNFKGNCATTVLHALLGRLEPNPRHVQAAYEGLYDITHLAAVVAVELYEQSGCYSNLYVPEENGSILNYPRLTPRGFDCFQLNFKVNCPESSFS